MHHHTSLIVAGASLLMVGHVTIASQAGGHIPNLKAYANVSGEARTLASQGAIDTSNPFFQSLGSNGRACVNCHEPGEGWSITPAGIRARFDETDGLHPLFRLVDGANAPNAPVATVEQRREAYSLLLNKGLIRVSMPIPDGAQFRLAAVDDPYHHAHAGEINMYRRPLPTANINFVSAVMWDGRESVIPANQPYLKPQDEHFRHQSQSAVFGHAEGGAISQEQQQAMVDFQRSLCVAQSTDRMAGELHGGGAKGGPLPMAKQSFYMGLNDSILPDPTGVASTNKVFDLYEAWLNAPGNSSVSAARRSIARGEQLFNTKPIRITGVSGVNDDLNAPLVVGTCTTCHNNPNIGNHTMRRALNIGLTDAGERTADLPLYTLERLDANGQPTGELKKTTDPGRAMVTGQWKDVGRFKGPVLRGLAARAPYFHNGLAATLEETVDFYDRRFDIGFTSQERADLAAFLRAL